MGRVTQRSTAMGKKEYLRRGSNRRNTQESIRECTAQRLLQLGFVHTPLPGAKADRLEEVHGAALRGPLPQPRRPGGMQRRGDQLVTDAMETRRGIFLVTHEHQEALG